MKKRASPKLEPNLVKEYEGKRPLYVEYCERLHDLICSLLKSAKCKFALTEKRAKKVKSLSDKLSGIEKDNIVNTLDDIKDLAGVRVVTNTPKDVNVVVGILRKEFGSRKGSAFEVKQHDEKTLGENAFGYRATHVYFKFNCARAGLTEWKEFKGLVAEVQIKTFFQHNWAVLEHELIYKPIEGFQEISEYALPQIRRNFAKLAAQFETADEGLDGIESEHAKIVKSQKVFAALVKRGKAGTEKLTNLSLDVFIKNGNGLSAVVDVADEAGFDRSDKPGSLEDFVIYATACSMSKIADVSGFLGRIKGRQKDLIAICDQAKSHRYRPPAALPFDVLIFLLALDHEPAFKMFQKSEYGPPIKKVITAVRKLKTQPKTQQNKK